MPPTLPSPVEPLTLIKTASPASPTWWNTPQAPTLVHLARSSPPNIVTHDGRLSIRFTRNTDAAAVTLTVQASNDLNVWTDVARSTGGNPLIAVANGVMVTETDTNRLHPVHASDATPSGGQRPPRRMLRLHVSK
jgi:hypothetical protein